MLRFDPRPRKLWSVVVLLVSVQLLYSCSGVALAQTTASTLDEIKTDFNAAMDKPLAERVPDLEALEQRIGTLLFEGELVGEDEIKGHRYLYHTRLQLAKYDEAADTYCTYLKKIGGQRDAQEAVTVYLRDINQWLRERDYAHLHTVSEKMRAAYSENPQVLEASLYHDAVALYHLNGLLEQAAELCNQLITEHPESRWRPDAMRLLANTQLGQGEIDAALATLNLMEQQYPNTRMAHYADMRQAAVWEYGRGDPQKALEIYNATLETYPSHVYAPYIHRQIERLQAVIEQQLIQDALEGLGKQEQKDEPLVQPDEGLTAGPLMDVEPAPTPPTTSGNETPTKLVQPLASR